MYFDAALALLDQASTDLVCVDAGSAGGAHPRFRAIRRRAQFIGFEPDPDEWARLNGSTGPGERYLNVALGRRNEQITLHLHRKRNTSSAYESDWRRVRLYHDPNRLQSELSQKLTTQALDDVCAREALPIIDYLKVDVEGHELAVLEGYSGRLLLAESEVMFHPFRKGAPLVDEMIRHMRERGLFLLDIRRTYWSPTTWRTIRNHPAKGVLVFGDALFALDPFLDSNLRHLATPEDRAKYLSLLCVYGYAAEALMIIDVLVEASCMDDREVGALRAAIAGHATTRKWFRLRVARLLLALERRFSLPVAMSEGLFFGDDAQTDGELGNWDLLGQLRRKQ